MSWIYREKKAKVDMPNESDVVNVWNSKSLVGHSV